MQVTRKLIADLTDPDGLVFVDSEGNSIPSMYQWSISDSATGTFTDITGATDALYTLLAADLGKYLKVTVSYSDGHGPNKTAQATSTVVEAYSNLPGTIGISGSPRVGDKLTADVVDPDGSTTDEAWQWSISDSATGTFTNISGGTDASYTPLAGDAAKFLKTTVAYSDGTTTSADQTAEIVIADAVAAAGTDLVSNLAEQIVDATDIRDIILGLAQTFRTGAGAATLTAARIEGGFSTGTVVSIHSDASGAPGSKLADLANPGHLTATLQRFDRVNRFTASGSGIALIADTPYWVVLTGNGRIHVTQSNDETGVSGWTINGVYQGLRGTTWAAGNPGGGNLVMPMAVEGTVTGGAQAADPPVVSATPSLNAADDDGQWAPGETVEIKLTFNEAVLVDTSSGAPTIELELSGTQARDAVYQSGSGTTELVFSYTLSDTDGSHTTIFITPNSLTLNGATIQSQTSNINADLDHYGTNLSATTPPPQNQPGQNGMEGRSEPKNTGTPEPNQHQTQQNTVPKRPTRAWWWPGRGQPNTTTNP